MVPSTHMNTSNPFQVPSCLQRADLQLRRRERFRRGVVVAVAAVVTLLVVLLIEGCMSEHAKTSTTANDAVTVQPEAAPTGAAAAAPAESKPIATPAQPVASPAAAPASPVVPAPQRAMPGGYRPQMLYVVKPGDTLSHIAKLNHTTVKALKTVNSLDTDMIAVGAKLKLPAA